MGVIGSDDLGPMSIISTYISPIVCVVYLHLFIPHSLTHSLPYYYYSFTHILIHLINLVDIDTGVTVTVTSSECN